MSEILYQSEARKKQESAGEMEAVHPAKPADARKA